MPRLMPLIRQSKRKIIKTHAGELGHLDCRYLGKDQIVGSKRRRRLVSMVDARARLAWAEVVAEERLLAELGSSIGTRGRTGRRRTGRELLEGDNV